MARLREFDDAAALKTIENVFWEKGYDATSYADLVAATGLGKGSLYAAFGNKKSLYIKTLEIYIADELAPLAKTLTQRHEENPALWRTGIRDFFDTAIDPVSRRGDRRGCLLCNAAVDLAPYDAQVKTVVAAGFSMTRNAFRAMLRDRVSTARLEGEGEHLLAIYIGMRIMARAGAAPAQLAIARDAALRAL